MKEPTIHMKKIITLALITLLTLLFATSASATYYKDVNYTYWAYSDIQFMTKHQVIKGFSTGHFRPGQTITRKDAAVMMTRALETKWSEVETPVQDLKSTSPGYVEIQAALERDWFTIYEGNFKPDAILTRDEMAKALATAFSYEGDGQSTFIDVPDYDPYYTYIDAILAQGVTEGYADQTYRPLENVTRAQFSAFLSRVFHQPIAYEVKQDGNTIYQDASMDRAIQFATTIPNSTVHPQSNRFMHFSQQIGNKNQTPINKGVLIYNGHTENDSFTTDFFSSYLSYTDQTGTVVPMFDSFVVLGLRYPGGQFAETSTNQAGYKDFQWYIDRTFAEDGAINRLDQAAKNVNQTVDVYVAIPYPKRTGLIERFDGTFVPNQRVSRQALVEWYINSAEARFKSAEFKNVQLKGFYWLNETVKVNDDSVMIHSIGAQLKYRGYHLIYAPHATSTNFKEWGSYQFDAAFLQPNAFRTATPDKEARLHKAFVNSQIYGSGITLEVNSYGPNQVEEGQEAWDLYMDFAQRYDLPESSFLFYQDRDMIHRMRTYSQPTTYQLWYQDIVTKLFAQPAPTQAPQ